MKLATTSLLFCLFVTAVSCSSNKLLQLPLAELTSGSRLADIKHALRDLGGLAITGIDQAAYTLAVQHLRVSAADCMASAAAGIKEVVLEDGLRRRSFVHMDDPVQAVYDEGWPACVELEMAAVEATFNFVERKMVGVLGRLLGNQTLLVAAPTPAAATRDRNVWTVRGLSELAAKTHLHVYDNNEAGRVLDQDESADKEEELSMPFHLDNGLYLLLTPSPVSPLRLRSRSGRQVRTDISEVNNTVIFLLGRGLTDWLLPTDDENKGNVDGGSHYRHLVPALHAVPSLRGTPAGTTRTVVARMRVAPLDAIPAAPLLASRSSPRPLRRFSDVFFDSAIRPSATSLCYLGGPLSRDESLQRNRRHSPDCWPHTQKC